MSADELKPCEKEYTITLAYHLREFLIFALDKWTEQGLNRGEATSIRAALLRDEGKRPLFTRLKERIQQLEATCTERQNRIRSLLKLVGEVVAENARLIQEKETEFQSATKWHEAYLTIEAENAWLASQVEFFDRQVQDRECVISNLKAELENRKCNS